MKDSDIYVKTDAGREEIRSRALGLPMSVRAILLMIDGQRDVGALRNVIAGSKAPPDVLDRLMAEGLIAPTVNGAASVPVPVAAPSPPPPPPAHAPVVPIAAPVVPVAAPEPVPAPTPSLHVPNRNAATGSRLDARPEPPPEASLIDRDEPLDLVLPTIYVPEPPAEAAPAASDAEPVAAAAAAAVPNRYEHLYQMMNEVVRDFLSPTRRYLFQLKIERATTPEELLELLHDLRTALAKSRGDAFASEVVARLRNAAG